jgi:PiT family inorganic phosphate transporter
MILFFLTSGLFLGWSLGANDASNIFGSAVGSKMISFRRAAIIASVFVILGAVLQGSGTSHTLGKLGAVNAIGGSFTVALSAAVTVYLMTKFSIPVSTTQAIVGSIIGWNLFTGNPTDGGAMAQIVTTWFTGPILGAGFAILLYMLVRRIKRKVQVHLFWFETYIRAGLVIAGAFGAYSLGANNIANVMGVFVPAFNLKAMDLGLFTLSSSQQLFLLGGIAIAVGIMTYSNRIMEVVGGNIVELSSEAALVVVLSQAMVLFIFSSAGLSSLITKIGLPPIPMVPVSSTQVIVGSVIGIGLYKGIRNINFRIVGEIGLGWIISPVMSGLFTFFSLFFVKNIFSIEVGRKIRSGIEIGRAPEITAQPGTSISGIMAYLLSGLLIAGIIVLLIIYFLERKRSSELKLSEEKFWKNIK